MYPFWSPDSGSIAFFVGRDLKTVRLTGGSVRTISSTPLTGVPSGAWNSNGTIVIGGTTHLWKVPESGGTPEPATIMHAGETAHRWPSFLPDGDRFIYFAQSELATEL